MITRIVVCAAVLFSAGVGYAKESKLPHKVKPASARKAKFKLIQVEKNIVTYTNRQRRRHGLPPLKIDTALVKSAREHAIWMTRHRTLQHTSRPVAENIAMGQPDSRDVVADWMTSSGHRANILHRGYRWIGAAAYRTPSGTIFWCQQFRR